MDQKQLTKKVIKILDNRREVWNKCGQLNRSVRAGVETCDGMNDESNFSEPNKYFLLFMY